MIKFDTQLFLQLGVFLADKFTTIICEQNGGLSVLVIDFIYKSNYILGMFRLENFSANEFGEVIDQNQYPECLEFSKVHNVLKNQRGIQWIERTISRGFFVRIGHNGAVDGPGRLRKHIEQDSISFFVEP